MLTPPCPPPGYKLYQYQKYIYFKSFIPIFYFLWCLAQRKCLIHMRTELTFRLFAVFWLLQCKNKNIILKFPLLIKISLELFLEIKILAQSICMF